MSMISDMAVTEIADKKFFIDDVTGTKTLLRRFSVYGLLPQTEDYITYEGSLTFPGCFETVTWVIMNNPIYITREDVCFNIIYIIITIKDIITALLGKAINIKCLLN